ncbi:maleylacetoacetate isomerase [Sphingobium sp. 3R8]|uniref:maleylacetoacetate isomerase n=1 Tax=Sphingobium sp. 3R8 TaxID=2874921 RepID=UPI001CCB5D71|nr:maleylacetoacetate isomerase [Sphingobium sp. 3R8]MBZ9647569.1 maleylacetoacetate isomerase [Sphingobium sp. 3R8]
MILHGYWRSSASYRVRIALGLKGVLFEQVTHDLRTSAHKSADYAFINPQHFVPALETDDGTSLMQSPAILEWLEERYPSPPLLPDACNDRAIVRAMAAIIGCDVHPLNNLRVLRSLKTDLHAQQHQVDAWTARWIGEGFSALERVLERYSGEFAFGDAPTLADCYIVPQVYSARRFNVDLRPFPLVEQVSSAAELLPAFAAAHPTAQPDADIG